MTFQHHHRLSNRRIYQGVQGTCSSPVLKAPHLIEGSKSYQSEVDEATMCPGAMCHGAPGDSVPLGQNFLYLPMTETFIYLRTRQCFNIRLVMELLKHIEL